MIGTRLAHFEITAHLGTGGMGEVYQATDSKLGRSVAIKLLPEAFARDAERVARFEREARVLASLNHPNIAAIYGIEQSGDRKFLVMELVAGETLAERIKRGPIPVEESLGIAKQICEALEAAHEKGIVHRDLKPANVKITPDSKVKVLDFGLAKAYETETSKANLSQSPTLSLAATNAGVILGTAAYMSPEQAKGLNTDSRSDVFSFGCVLYEMLTGRQAFQGDTVSDLMASVLAREPEFKLLPPDLNPRFYDLLRRCFEKNPKRRWQAVGDLRAELDIVAADPFRKPEAAAAAVLPKYSKRLRWVVRFATVLLIVALAIPAFFYLRGSPPAGEVRFEIPVPPMPSSSQISVSPDGRKIAFVASTDGNVSMLFVRPIDSVSAQPLAGTQDAIEPFWSPDSRYIGFSSGPALKKVEATGGPPQVLSDLGGAGTWNADGVIVFSNGGKLHRVSAAGGVPVPITSPDASLQETGHSWPYFLPDGRHFLYLAWSGLPANRAIYVGSLDSGKRTRILAVDSMGVFVSPGFLIFQRQGTLFAQKFDAAALTLLGDPVRLAEDIPFSVAGATLGRAAFAASGNGVLIYRRGRVGNKQFVWLNRSGKQLATAGPPAIYGQFDLSPDGRQIAVARVEPGTATSTQNIWLLDWERNVLTRLTSETLLDDGPIWSADGLRIAFSRLRGDLDIFETRASNIGSDAPMLEASGNQRVEDWSRDGRYIVYLSYGGAVDILPLFGDRKPFSLVKSKDGQDEPHFSFDGKWVAYNSGTVQTAGSESVTPQVYVISFPAADQKHQISTNGGVQARWRQDGRELYYLALDGKLMAVDISTAAGKVQSGIPRVLFDTQLNVSITSEQYAVTGDGQRFLFQMPLAESAPIPITVVLNWTAKQ